MKLRQLLPSDERELRYLHAQYYYPEFSFPDFRKFIATFAVCDENDHIITAGGIKPIAESIIITDKFRSKLLRVRALHEILGTSIMICKQNNIDQLHAFIDGKTWEKALKSVGFNDCNGRALVLQV